MSELYSDENQFRKQTFCRVKLVLFAFVIFCLAPHASAQTSNDSFVLTPEKLQGDGEAEPDKALWRYRFGDDMRWAAKDYDDSTWATRGFNDGVRSPQSSPIDARWQGRAWFRLHLKVDERLANQPLALRYEHWGASEVYIDGKLIKRFGRINANSDVEENPRYLPVSFVLTEGGEHIVAMRYSYMAARDTTQGIGRWLMNGDFRPGFEMALYSANAAAARSVRNSFNARGNRLYVGILAAFGLLHFLLYVFYRRERANLFYSLFAMGLAATQTLSPYYQSGFPGGANTGIGAGVSFVLFIVAFAIAMPSLLAFHYIAFQVEFSKLFRLILALWLLTAILTVFYVRVNLTLYAVSISFAFTLLDAIRIMVLALVGRRPGAWIVMTGLLIFTAGVCVSLGHELIGFKISDFVDELQGYAILLAVPFAVSIYLARNFARTNTNLEAQLQQVQQLSIKQIEHERTEAELRLQHEQTRAENERRAKELEEARALQLSMLPKKLPQVSNLEIAAYMKPATEVGGDYYDFHVSDDGTLTVAVGDATGHGLKAGTMVTAAKSLFRTFAAEPDITQIFRRSTSVLKEMNLRALFMAMTIVKVKDNQLTLSAAGMPSTLIYHAATGIVEEVALTGMPLGSVRDFPYKQRQFALAPGDAVVLMSDGFPERFNEQNEMIDYERAKSLLKEVARESSQAIINRFVETGDAWAGAKAQDDDVTFVVLKVKDATA